MDPINDDLLSEIFIRLPTKSLKRFQCVSKTWRCLISNVISQKAILLPMSGLFFHRDRYDGNYDDEYALKPLFYASTSDDKDYGAMRPYLTAIMESYIKKGIKLELIHHCNGLLLLYSLNRDNGDQHYCVCNPVTQEFVPLPMVPADGLEQGFVDYDPRSSPHYRVIRLLYSSDCSVYSSVTCRWSNKVQLKNNGNYFGAVVYYEGYFYSINGSGCLLKIDLRNHTCTVLANLVTGDDYTFYLGVSRQCLYFALHCNENFKLEIWKFHDKEPSGRKVLIHTIDSRVFYQQHPHPSVQVQVHRNIERRDCVLFPVAFHPDSDIIYIGLWDIIYAYDPNNGRLYVVHRIGTESVLRDTERAFAITPCLESLDPPGEKCFLSPIVTKSEIGKMSMKEKIEKKMEKIRAFRKKGRKNHF